MSPNEVSRALRLRLAGELKINLGALGRRTESVRRMLAAREGTAEGGATELRTLALALEIERFYTAVDATLERRLQGLDGDTPRGAHGQADLLRAASVPLAGFRPALVSVSAAAALRELISPCHFARHAYDVEPRSARVDALGALVLSIEAELLESLGAIVRHLEQQTRVIVDPALVAPAEGVALCGS